MNTFTSLYGTGLVDATLVNCSQLVLNGSTVNLTNYFDKAADDSDDIKEGSTNKFDHLTVSAPLVRTLDNVALPMASVLDDGYLSSTDFGILWSKEDALSFSSPLTRTTNTIALPQASASVSGYLSSADFTTFNAASGLWTSIAGPYLENSASIKMKGGTGLYIGAYTVIGSGREIVGSKFTWNDGVSPFDAITSSGAIVSKGGFYKDGDATALIDVSRNADVASLKVGSTTVVDSSRNATFRTISWDGTGSGGGTGTLCDIYGSIGGTALAINGTTVVDGSKNVNANALSINSTQVISSSRTITTQNSCVLNAPSSTTLTLSTVANPNSTNNTWVGMASGKSTASSVDTTAVGYQTGNALTTGSSNTLVGSTAGKSITNASGNTFVGFEAGRDDITGSENTCVGKGSGYRMTGYGNACVGSQSGLGITSGWYNNCLGMSTGWFLSTETSCTYIGYAAGNNSAPPGNCCLYVQGTNFSGYSLYTVSGTALQYNSSTGQIGPVPSARRYKTALATLEEEKVDPAVIYQLKPCAYSLKADVGSEDPKENKKRHIGYIAEEVNLLLPNTGVVPLNGDGEPESINYERLVVLVVEEMKALRRRIDAVEKKLEGNIATR